MSKPARRPPPIKIGLVLIGHGSRVPGANQVLEQVAVALRRRYRRFAIEPAFLELAQPDIPCAIDRCVATGAKRILFVPYFLYLGGHVGRDLPEHMAQARFRHPGLEIRIAPHLGFDRRVVAVAIDRISQGLRAGKWA